MDVNNQELSLSLYNYLCTVVGSEDIVRTKRRIYNASDYVLKTNKVTQIFSGSTAEGLNLSGSDYDIMAVWNKYPVYENIEGLNKHQQSRQKTIPLIMDTNDTTPGYTRLKLYDNNDKYYPFGKYCYSIGHETFVSSTLFRERFADSPKLAIHGPCRSYGLFDIVSCFHCKTWILQADEWIRRLRLSWPNNRLIEAIVQCGVFFVPIGCKNSPREELEFRISFNVAEKILVHSFSHVQLLCYVLLKTILNHFIKPKYGDLLFSYILKTIMFWVSEEWTESTWKPHNLIQCFDRCFRRLVYCVTYSTCSHYFIPGLDLLKNRFSKFEHDSLKKTLQSLYNSGLQCVLRTKLFSSFNYVIHQSPASIVPYVSALPSVVNTSMMEESAIHDVALILLRSVFGSLNLPWKQIYALMLSQKAAKCGQINETFHITNTQRYQTYRRHLCYLLLGLNHDAVSGWLLLASFFYTHKQYQQCLYVLNYCLHKCTPDKILLELQIDPNLQQKFNIEMHEHGMNILSACKWCVVGFVNFEQTSSIMPAELSAIVLDEGQDFPPVVFAHFLRCICLHHLNRNTDKLNALRDLEATVRDMYFIPLVTSEKAKSRLCIDVARQLLTE